MTEAGPNPYVGPLPFKREEGQRFFGREREARNLLARVISEQLVLFYAQSGAGKSSLINTRLIPQLQAAGFGVLPVGRVSGALPAGAGAVDNIFVFNLCLSLDKSQGDPGRFSRMPLKAFLARLTTPDGERYYYQAESEVESGDYESAPSVLIIDQFEEIITTSPEHWPQRADFFRQLDQAMAADPLLWVVLTLREDYIAALEPYAYLLAGKLRARFYMQRMGYEAALEAVEQPARLGGRPFAGGVAQTLVDNLRQIRTPQTPPSPSYEGGLRGVGQYVEPVQLQVVCYQLWENLHQRAGDGVEASAGPPPKGSTPYAPDTTTGSIADRQGFKTPSAPGREITAADLETLGNIDTALAKFYEQALQKTLTSPLPLSSSQERGPGGEVSENQLRTWFDQKLITEAGTRGTVYQGPHETAGLPNGAVTLLAGQYLLRAEIRAGGTWYELVHDRFIEPIQQSNRAWREQRLRQNPLLQAAQSWLDSGRDPAQLYQGQQLQAALAGLDRANLEPLAREFLEAGEEAQRRRELAAATRQARRLRWFVGALALGLLILLGAATFAWNQSLEAEAQRLEADAARTLAEARREEAETAQAEAIAVTGG